MSQQYDNTNRFALFFNENKRNENGPDYSGTLNVDGVEYFIDAWQKDGRSGTFYSGKIKLKEKQGKERQAAPAPRQQPARDTRTHGQRMQAQRTGTGFDAMDDDIPF